jgi:hypothetical protein
MTMNEFLSTIQSNPVPIGLGFLLFIGLLGLLFQVRTYWRYGRDYSLLEGFDNNNNTEDASKNTNSVISLDKDNMVASLKHYVSQLQDELQINKYHSSYENIILHLENIVSLSLLKQTVMNAEPLSSSSILSKSNQNTIKSLNELNQLRESLNQAMVILDENK